jgi:PAS domain S-box-containing protein
MKIASQPVARGLIGKVEAPNAAGLGSLEGAFVGLAQLAAQVCDAQWASILIRGGGEFCCTISGRVAAADVPDRDAFLPYTDEALGLFVVADATVDARFRDGYVASATLRVRSYAGCALRTAQGELIGTFAVYGARAHALSTVQRSALLLLVEQALNQTELHRRLAEAAPSTPTNVRAACPSVPLVGTVSQISDLVTARDNLRKAHALYSNTFDQAPIGIAYADRAGKFLSCNPAFCAMLGFHPGELAERTIDEITNGEDIARAAVETERLWEGDIEFVDLEKRYTRRDGSALWVHMTTALVHEDSAEPEYSVQFLRDITASKESAQELERVNKELMSASRQAGMAEVATNVLHNVGNILNSVNISASLVAERIKQSKAPGISRLANLLHELGPNVGEYIGNDERGKRIPQYLAGVGEQLVNDQQMTLRELHSLRENLEHIKETVAMQQSYAKLCGVTETVEAVDLVEDSLRLNAGAFVRHGVTLKREFDKVPPITVDKHKVLQILVNLVRNAKYACDESGRSDKLLTLRIERVAHNEAVRISVIDNGVGIPSENVSRLFSHGFTTRQSGHGFGLHSSALAAQELGATLQAQSDGPGLGATFVLELPRTPVKIQRV